LQDRLQDQIRLNTRPDVPTSQTASYAFLTAIELHVLSSPWRHPRQCRVSFCNSHYDRHASL